MWSGSTVMHIGGGPFHVILSLWMHSVMTWGECSSVMLHLQHMGWCNPRPLFPHVLLWTPVLKARTSLIRPYRCVYCAVISHTSSNTSTDVLLMVLRSCLPLVECTADMVHVDLGLRRDSCNLHLVALMWSISKGGINVHIYTANGGML